MALAGDDDANDRRDDREERREERREAHDENEDRDDDDEDSGSDEQDDDGPPVDTSRGDDNNSGTDDDRSVDDDRSKADDRDATSGAENRQPSSDRIRNITVTYPDGWIESIVDGQCELIDDLNRRVILRPAKAKDFARMMALG
jgi:hypothetical protein